MLYEFRGLPCRLEGFEPTLEGELSRIRASENVEDGDGEDTRYCGFCGGKLKPGTEDYEEHCHQKCSI